MKFYTSYYWQPQEGGTSLILQQVSRKKGKETALFACVCTEEERPSGSGGLFCRQLVDWFHEEALALWHKREEEIPEKLKKKLTYMGAEPGMQPWQLSVAGILCLGEAFVLFYQGKQRIYLLNQGLCGAHGRLISQENTQESGGMYFQEGILEPAVGLLLATEPFYRGLTQDMLVQCLGGEKEVCDEWIFRRLRELGDFQEKQSGRNAGAVFLRSYSHGQKLARQMKMPTSHLEKCK